MAFIGIAVLIIAVWWFAIILLLQFFAGVKTMNDKRE